MSPTPIRQSGHDARATDEKSIAHLPLGAAQSSIEKPVPSWDPAAGRRLHAHLGATVLP
jgi:hypothetical protein